MLAATSVVADDSVSAYDSNRHYTGACDSDKLYWTDVSVVPNCETTGNFVAKRDFHCATASLRLTATGVYRDTMAQYRNGGSDGNSIGPFRWQFLTPGYVNSTVECASDWGIHGDGRPDHRWPAAATNVSDPFAVRERDALRWNMAPRDRSYTVYDGNYLNWRAGREVNGEDGFTQSAAASEPTPGTCSVSSAAPVVAVNALNRTQHLNDVYLLVFNPQPTVHWPGGLQKLVLQQQRIVANGNEEFAAASQTPEPATRRLFSNIVSNDLSASGNAIAVGNEALDLVEFGLSDATGEPGRDELVAWARSLGMGDSLHSQPAAIDYGGDTDNSDTVVYVADNNGFLHAISGEDGRELWAFMPRQLLSNLNRLYFDEVASSKQFGLDGDLVPVVGDVDGDGRIEIDDGDFVYLIFGMRRGGQSYFALDVSDRQSPKVLWTFDSKESGDSWSTPAISRIHVSGISQNPNRSVVVIGGGYDTVHDTAAHPAGPDGSGAGIHILDLQSGERLWRAGMDAGANLPLNFIGREMDRAIPNQTRVIDLNGDGFADRMYASDLGGQLWRFDIHNGESPNDLVTGGVIAQLGADRAGAAAAAADTRRFYNAPDVSMVTDRDGNRFIAVSVGSGYRAQVDDVSASDRFFSIRDPDVFRPLSQSDYDNYPVIEMADLVAVNNESSANLDADDRGWMYVLPADEKILTESVTFNDQIYFVSFSPKSSASDNCAVSQGENFLYRVNALDGSTIEFDADTTDAGSESATAPEQLQYGGIAPSPKILFPGPDADCESRACVTRPVACIGTECFTPDFDAYPVRTLWTQAGVD